MVRRIREGLLHELGVAASDARAPQTERRAHLALAQLADAEAVAGYPLRQSLRRSCRASSLTSSRSPGGAIDGADRLEAGAGEVAGRHLQLDGPKRARRLSRRAKEAM